MLPESQAECKATIPGQCGPGIGSGAHKGKRTRCAEVDPQVQSRNPWRERSIFSTGRTGATGHTHRNKEP